MIFEMHIEEVFTIQIRTNLLLKMQEMGLVDMWFQQDGAICHTARATMDLMKNEFGEQLISCLNWMARMPSMPFEAPTLYSLRKGKVSCLHRYASID